MTTGITEATVVFDEHAEAYDKWFKLNGNVLLSELLLLKKALGNPGRTLSVGCGSGLFESMLKTRFGIEINEGVEPSDGMAAIAEKRGIKVLRVGADSASKAVIGFDTVLFNGSSSYIENPGAAFAEAHKALRGGGRLVVLDVTAEGGYGTLYDLAAQFGTWDHPKLKIRAPKNPYPTEFLSCVCWKSVPEKTALIENAGFRVKEYWQTLTTHPLYSNDAPQEPAPGYTKGDYVAVIAVKEPLPPQHGQGLPGVEQSG